MPRRCEPMLQYARWSLRFCFLRASLIAMRLAFTSNQGLRMTSLIEGSGEPEGSSWITWLSIHKNQKHQAKGLPRAEWKTYAHGGMAWLTSGGSRVGISVL